MPAAYTGAVSVAEVSGYTSFFLSALVLPIKGIRAAAIQKERAARLRRERRAAAIKISKDIYGFCACGKMVVFSGANNNDLLVNPFFEMSCKWPFIPYCKWPFIPY